MEFRLLRDEFHMIRERALIEIKNHTILQGIWSHLIENDAEMEIEFERLGPEDGLYLSHQPSPSYQDTPISTESGKTPQPSPSMENVLYDTHNSNSVPKGPSPSSISESPESGLIHCPTPETIPCHKTEAKSKPRPRKGHKKSRHGCFSCKSRKIKVCLLHSRHFNDILYTDITNFVQVSRNSTTMLELHKEQNQMHIPSSQNTRGCAAIGGVRSKSYILRQPTIDSSKVYFDRYADIPTFPSRSIPVPSSGCRLMLDITGSINCTSCMFPLHANDSTY